MIPPALNLDSQVHREAKLALLRLQVMQRMQRTDLSAQNVEEALARLAEANAPTDLHSQQR